MIFITAILSCIFAARCALIIWEDLVMRHEVDSNYLWRSYFLPEIIPALLILTLDVLQVFNEKKKAIAASMATLGFTSKTRESSTATMGQYVFFVVRDLEIPFLTLSLPLVPRLPLAAPSLLTKAPLEAEKARPILLLLTKRYFTISPIGSDLRDFLFYCHYYHSLLPLLVYDYDFYSNTHNHLFYPFFFVFLTITRLSRASKTTTIFPLTHTIATFVNANVDRLATR